MAKSSFFHFCGSVSMIVWIPLLKKLMVPPADNLAAVGNCHPRERDLVALRRLRPARERQPLHADVLLRDRP